MNIFEAYNKTKKELEAAGIEDYVFEAKQIIKHITAMSSSEILMNYTKELGEYRENNLTAIIKQRAVRYPLQYIFGEWSFYGRSFYVGPGVLIPRADTETVVDVCLESISAEKPVKVLDLCAGSGCIGITLAAERKNACVTMVERYPEAARYAERSIKRHGTENTRLVIGDVCERVATEESYDLIVSNPPYIAPGEMNTVSPEVHYEPETALNGGDDGLDFYRTITEGYKNSLTPGGMLVFEVGASQAEAVKQIMAAAGFEGITAKRDAASIERAVYGFKGLREE